MWRMRGMFDALHQLTARLGITLFLEHEQVAKAIAAAHKSDIDGRNHGPGRSGLKDPYGPEGAMRLRSDREIHVRAVGDE